MNPSRGSLYRVNFEAAAEVERWRASKQRKQRRSIVSEFNCVQAEDLHLFSKFRLPKKTCSRNTACFYRHSSQDRTKFHEVWLDFSMSAAAGTNSRQAHPLALRQDAQGGHENTFTSCAIKAWINKRRTCPILKYCYYSFLSLW